MDILTRSRSVVDQPDLVLELTRAPKIASGAELRAAREVRELSVSKLARMSGVHHLTITAWEAGKTPKYATAEKVVNAVKAMKPQ